MKPFSALFPKLWVSIHAPNNTGYLLSTTKNANPVREPNDGPPLSVPST